MFVDIPDHILLPILRSRKHIENMKSKIPTLLVYKHQRDLKFPKLTANVHESVLNVQLKQNVRKFTHVI